MTKHLNKIDIIKTDRFSSGLLLRILYGDYMIKSSMENSKQ